MGGRDAIDAAVARGRVVVDFVKGRTGWRGSSSVFRARGHDRTPETAKENGSVSITRGAALTGDVDCALWERTDATVASRNMQAFGMRRWCL